VTRVHRQVLSAIEVVTVASGPPWQQNCYLIVDRPTGAYLIVDPGFDTEELRDAIAAMGRAPEHMVVTHGHPDHIGAAALVSELTGVPCRISVADERTARHAPAYAAAFAGLRIRVPARFEQLSGDDTLSLGATAVVVRSVPGHTPGSLAFDIGEALLTGDTLFRERAGRTDLPGGDRDALVRSIERLVAGLSPDVRLFAGHGQPWTAREARDWLVAGGLGERAITR